MSNGGIVIILIFSWKKTSRSGMVQFGFSEDRIFLESQTELAVKFKHELV